MANKRQRKPSRQASGRAGTSQTKAKRCVENLRRRFANFHRAHSPGTRIPQTLRDAALLALRNGIPESEVRQACRINSTQLKLWQRSQGHDAKKSEAEGQMVRVFPVVEEEIEVPTEPSSVQASRSLSLSIGGWDVFIRRNDE